MELASRFDDASSSGLGMDTVSNMGASTSTPINSSNIGFQLLKKHGWKEETGLGIAEQNLLKPLLEPIQAYINNVKIELESHKPKNPKEKLRNPENPDEKSEKIFSKLNTSVPKRGDLVLAMGSPFGIWSPVHFFNKIYKEIYINFN